MSEKNRGLSNEFLEKLVRASKVRYFKGVFPQDFSDQINIDEKEACIIINKDFSYNKGSHFVVLYKTTDKIIYFDSFGEKPDFFTFDFLSKFNIPLIICDKKIQSIYSDFCGLYCFGFILAFQSGIKVNKFLNFFLKGNEQELLLNDKLIQYFIKKITI